MVISFKRLNLYALALLISAILHLIVFQYGFLHLDTVLSWLMIFTIFETGFYVVILLKGFQVRAQVLSLFNTTII